MRTQPKYHPRIAAALRATKRDRLLADADSKPEPAGHIREAIVDFIRKLDEANSETDRRIADIWDSIVGPEAAAHTAPGSVANKSLVVFADSSPWLDHVVRMETGNILARMRSEFGPGKIMRISPRLSPSAVAAWLAN